MPDEKKPTPTPHSNPQPLPGGQATPGSIPAGQASHASPGPTTTAGNTPVADPKAQQVHQPVSAPDQGAAGGKPPAAPEQGNKGGGENATATPGASPVVSTDGAKQAVEHASNERDVSQGSAAKGGTGQVHPVTGGPTTEYRLSGPELMQIASQRFQIDTASGVTELVWDANNHALVFRHSPPFAGVQG